jgi:hypothetical protein
MFKQALRPVITLSLVGLSQTAAFAHPDLKTASPAPASSVAEVNEIRLYSVKV